MKISKHICFFYQESRIPYISGMINEASKYPYPTDIFIHTTKIFPLTQFTKHDTVTVHLIGHDFTDSDPFLLPWKVRDLMKTQKDAYDIFIYVEDDILIPANAIKYWEIYNKKLSPNKLNIGFVRIEVDSIGEEFISDFHNEHCLPAQVTSILQYKDEVYAINNINTYTAFWIYNKEEFSDFIKSPYYDLVIPEGRKPTEAREAREARETMIRGYHIREAAAIGLHGIRDPLNQWYIHTLIPIVSNQLHPDSRVYHIPNTYVKDPHCFFATIRFDEAIAFNSEQVCNPQYVYNRKISRLQIAVPNPSN